MTTDMGFQVAATKVAPTELILRVEAKQVTDCSKCEGNVHVGMFFDGTNNNRDADRPKLAHTNVVRLCDAYPDDPQKGYLRYYIPGVGTAFPEIGETGESSLGNGFGIGCEERVLYALLCVFDALHKSAFDNAPFLDDAQIAALCRNSTVGSANEDQDSAILRGLGLSAGLQIPTFFGQGMRTKILRELADRLRRRLVKGRPTIKECFIDVFGFSRGAAEARVFCSWLDEILVDSKLAGVTVHFRFLGLMDTVASAGFVSCVKAGIAGSDGGHSGWAEARYLRVPLSVANCVHMIAAHELRKNFPLDTISVNGKLPARFQEFIYPGAHSDVGGGYAPGDLGISFARERIAADANKLSQIPLNHMLACAIAAGTPLKKEIAKDKIRKYDPFALSPAVQKAYDNFVTCSTLSPRPVHEWLQPYLNWRWQVRNHYTSLKHVHHASEKDKNLLLDYNAKLISDANFLARPLTVPNKLMSLLSPALAIVEHSDLMKNHFFEPEARSVLATAMAAAPVDNRLNDLFDLYVHDSLAGFNHNAIELSGYWRHRRGFLGSEKRLIVENAATTNTDRELA